MKVKVLQFIVFFVAFSICFFFGEWLMDIVFQDERSALSKEILESIFIGLFVSILVIFINRIQIGKKKVA